MRFYKGFCRQHTPSREMDYHRVPLASIVGIDAGEKHHTADRLPVVLVNQNGLCTSRERGGDNLFPPFTPVIDRTVAVVSLALNSPAW